MRSTIAVPGLSIAARRGALLLAARAFVAAADGLPLLAPDTPPITADAALLAAASARAVERSHASDYASAETTWDRLDPAIAIAVAESLHTEVLRAAIARGLDTWTDAEEADMVAALRVAITDGTARA